MAPATLLLSFAKHALASRILHLSPMLERSSQMATRLFLSYRSKAQCYLFRGLPWPPYQNSSPTSPSFIDPLSLLYFFSLALALPNILLFLYVYCLPHRNISSMWARSLPSSLIPAQRRWQVLNKYLIISTTSFKDLIPS